MTSTVTQVIVDADRLALLAATVTGPVLVPGDEGFTEECAGFNLSGQASVPNAVDNRDAGFTLMGGAAGTPEDIDPQIALLEDILERVRPWSTPHKYLNFISGEDRVETAYTPTTFRRLREIKTAYDPNNVFRLNNHNILPR
jgi:hypothetical protein